MTALDGLDLRVEPGEIVGLIGHNGAGKSTFINIAAGLERSDAGSVLVAGYDAQRAPRQARSRLGLAPQNLALYLHATGWDNLRLFAGLAGLRGRRMRRRIDEVTTAMGLSGLLERPVGLLSGGQQRRLQAATALLHRPPVLLLDEPTVGADLEARRALLAVIRNYAEHGAAICYTTHYLSELEELGASLAVLAAGKVIARGTRDDLLADLPGNLRLRFAGRPPAHLVAACPNGSMSPTGELTIPTHRPAAELANVMRILGGAAEFLTGVDIAAADLDDLYLHLVARQTSTEASRSG